jgi:hypothetical protein
MPLVRSFATYSADADAFAAFECWDGNTSTPWIEEVQDHVRAWALSHNRHVVAFRDDDQLVAVAGFNPREISVPLVDPEVVPAWHLNVLAVTLSRQRRGMSSELLVGTFSAMREVDPGRDVFTVRVHESNAGSLALCVRHNLAPFPRRADDPYIELLGDVDC